MFDYCSPITVHPVRPSGCWLCLLSLLLFTVRQQSCGKVMFSLVSVILFTEGRVGYLWSHSLPGCVWVGIPSPPAKGHGTRDPLHALEGTWDQRYPTPRNHKSGRYVSYWIAFLFLLFATVPVAAWSNIRKTLTIRAINSCRFQKLNIPNKFLKLHVVYLIL